MTTKAEINQEFLLREELKRTGGNLSKVARTLGMDYGYLARRFGSNNMPKSYFIPTGPEPEDIRTLGREGWQQYVIAVRPVGMIGAWPAKYSDVLANARASFDNGTHEMFQTTDNGWVVQYLIPYRRAIRRKPYFANMTPVE